jgi:hypothetical protein
MKKQPKQKQKKAPASGADWVVYLRAPDGRYVDEQGRELNIDDVIQDASQRELS